MGPRPGQPTASDAAAKEGEPTAKVEPPPEPPKPIERVKTPEPPPKPLEPPKPAEPAVKLPSLEKPPPPKPEAKKPEPKPEPKPVEAKKPEPPKPEPKVEQKTPGPPKAAQATTNSTAPPKPATEAKPATETKPAGKPGGKPDGDADGGDSYAAAANKWRAKGATGGGGGLAGTDTSPGPLGTPGYGGGGGGQVVGFEFLAYQQRVVTTVKGVWTNAAPRPGLVAKVRFQIAPNGDVSGVRLEQPSGDGVFDGSALRAVQRANPLPPPPARYVNEFREFVIEFHSEEGGQASG
jgi:colicin import membrane protein